MMHLLFDRARTFLGEVSTQGGALERVTLTPDGEREIGALVKLWQTRGVPIRKEIASKDAEGKQRQLVFYKEYVPPRTKDFAAALGMWSADYALVLLDLDDKYVAYWQLLAKVPLMPEERFAYLVVIRQTPDALLPEWKRGLEEAIRTGDAQAMKRKLVTTRSNPFLKR
jgi:hypothetical protein